MCPLIIWHWASRAAGDGKLQGSRVYHVTESKWISGDREAVCTHCGEQALVHMHPGHLPACSLQQRLYWLIIIANNSMNSSPMTGKDSNFQGHF